MKKISIVDASGKVLGYIEGWRNNIYRPDGILRGYYTKLGSTIYASFCGSFGGMIAGQLIVKDENTWMLVSY